MRDLRRGLHFEIRNRNFTSISRDGHARSPQRVAFRNHASEALRLPRNHEPRSYKMGHWPRKSILKLKFQKCNPSQELSPLTTKFRIHGADSVHLPRKTQSFEWRTPANVLAMSTKYCACHVNSRFWPLKVTDSLHLPCKVKFMSENVHEHPVKRCLRNCDFRGPHFVRACAVEINRESQNGVPAQMKPPGPSGHWTNQELTDSRPTIHELRFKNYDSRTTSIHELRFTNYLDSGTTIHELNDSRANRFTN